MHEWDRSVCLAIEARSFRNRVKAVESVRPRLHSQNETTVSDEWEKWLLVAERSLHREGDVVAGVGGYLSFSLKKSRLLVKSQPYVATVGGGTKTRRIRRHVTARRGQISVK